MVLLSGQAFAGSAPAVKKGQSTPNAPAKTVNPKTGIDTTPRDHPFELDANAKLVCEETKLTLKPVWKGPASLTFAFHLHNAGTADLKIKAQGG